MPDTRRALKDSQPYRATRPQMHAASILEAQHDQSLYAFGELGLFTLMWSAADFKAGLVPHCQTCNGSTGSITNRQSAAFDQPTQRECPDCYGTTFEGGFRAQIIRPMLMADRDSETNEESKGLVTTDTISFETTSDFSFHRGDYLFRADNTRFQTEERNEVVLRSGFSFPSSNDSFSGQSVAHLEEATTVAYLIPPLDLHALRTVLGRPGPFLGTDLVDADVIRPNGYL